MARLGPRQEETVAKASPCTYGENPGDSHTPGIKFPACSSCGIDAGCTRCRNQRRLLKCKACNTVTNMMPWFRETQKPFRENNKLATVGTVRFVPTGFPCIVEGDGWIRPCRIDAMPLRRRLTTVQGAYLDDRGSPFFPDEWEDEKR